VLAKGHGLQRCVVLSLLQALILSEREQLLSPSEPQEEPDSKRIILAIEEPELYIHPQLQKLLYDVMREFGKRDQVIYSTHSALFVDVYEYESISVVRKESANQGTKVFNCDTTAFDGIKDNDKKMYKGISRFNADTNELFFAKKVLLVEGSQDRIAVTETARAEGLIQFRTEEIDVSVIVAGGKDAIPSLQRILNAFKIPYRVLHDTDITEGMSQDDKCVQEKTNKTIETLAGKDNVVKFPIKLENTLRLPEGHLKDLYTAWVYFSDETNINAELRAIVKKALLGV
jgi:CRISPR-associated exonuclease Cas4